MEVTNLFLAIIYFQLTGILVFKLFVPQNEKTNVLYAIAVSWILGLGISTFAFFLFSLIFPQVTLVQILAIPFILAPVNYYFKKRVKVTLNKTDLIGISLVTFIGILLSMSAFAKPIFSFDAIAFWSAKARAIFIDGRVTTDTLKLFMSSDYPLLVPISQAITSIFVGSFNLVLLKGLTLITSLNILILIYYSVSKYFHFWAAALTVIIVSSITPFMDLTIGEHAGEADIVFALILLATVLAFLHRQFLLSGILAACLIWTKQEGLMPTLILSAIIFWKERKYFWQFASTPFLVSVSYFLFLKSGGVHGQYVLAGNYQRDIVKYILYPAQAFREEMRTLRLWNLVWWMFFATILINFKKVLKYPTNVVAIIFFGQVTFYVAVFAWTPHDQATQVATTISRLVFQLLPLGILLIALTLGKENY